MKNTNDKRNENRYSISEYLKEEYENVFIEIKFDKPIKAYVTDISMNGIGYEIKSLNFEDQKKLHDTDDFFVNINLIENKLLVEVKKAWSALTGNVYRGGLLFSVISPEDRLVLLKFLENIRIRK